MRSAPARAGRWRCRPQRGHLSRYHSPTFARLPCCGIMHDALLCNRRRPSRRSLVTPATSRPRALALAQPDSQARADLEALRRGQCNARSLVALTGCCVRFSCHAASRPGRCGHPLLVAAEHGDGVPSRLARHHRAAHLARLLDAGLNAAGARVVSGRSPNRLTRRKVTSRRRRAE